MRLLLPSLVKQKRVKNVDPEPPQRTKEEIARDASIARDAHRKGHGHHVKRARRAAAPKNDDEDDDHEAEIDEEPGSKYAGMGRVSERFCSVALFAWGVSCCLLLFRDCWCCSVIVVVVP